MTDSMVEDASDEPRSVTVTSPRFEFTIEWAEPQEWQEWEPGWRVYLPHQCDTWDIAGEGEHEPPVSREEAIEALDAFIVEATQALDALQSLPEGGPHA